ncbi:MAG TPA: hypothetical protein DIW44_04445 [Anaerolineaceae bacterium]|nr:hypothetical protein [Anaerolineaceae bacterium]
MEIVIVSPESRRRDNLISMLESIVLPSSIKMVELCGDVIKIANPADPAIVFIDYREPERIIDKSISNLIMNQAIHYVVLLVSHNGPNSHFTHFSSIELIYDEINIEMLKHLLVNVQLKSK